ARELRDRHVVDEQIREVTVCRRQIDAVNSGHARIDARSGLPLEYLEARPPRRLDNTFQVAEDGLGVLDVYVIRVKIFRQRATIYDTIAERDFGDAFDFTFAEADRNGA